MKHKLLVLIIGLTSLAFTVSSIFSQTITVSGAGTAEMNGIYTLGGTYNGKSYYAKDVNRRFIFWRYRSADEWEILDSTLPQPSYTHSANTTNPPQTGWTVAAEGSSPAPTLSGSGTSVELFSFAASQCTEGISLNWTTASEVNAVGFIIDPKSIQETDWQQIASYLTDSNLVCLNNQIGNAEYSYTDNTVQPNTTYSYRLSEVDVQGNVAALQEIKVTASAVAQGTDLIIPECTELLPANPNPFNPETTIKYNLAKDGVVTLSEFNILGQKVRSLIADIHQESGNYSLTWNTRSDSSKKMPSGIYFVVFKAGEYFKTNKILLMR